MSEHKEIKHQITGDMYIEWPPVKAKQEQRSDSEQLSTECVSVSVGEPVAWVNPDDLYDLEAGEDGDVPYVVRGNEQPKNMPKSIPLYTTPQPAQKPLTDKQIADIVIEMNGNEPTALFWKDLTRAIEAAHGIKENT